jgi:hypothetical protein
MTKVGIPLFSTLPAARPAPVEQLPQPALPVMTAWQPLRTTLSVAVSLSIFLFPQGTRYKESFSNSGIASAALPESRGISSGLPILHSIIRKSSCRPEYPAAAHEIEPVGYCPPDYRPPIALALKIPSFPSFSYSSAVFCSFTKFPLSTILTTIEINHMNIMNSIPASSIPSLRRQTFLLFMGIPSL